MGTEKPARKKKHALATAVSDTAGVIPPAQTPFNFNHDVDSSGNTHITKKSANIIAQEQKVHT